MSFNPFSLAGKTILVTGASSGIGRGIAVECSKLGAKLVVSGRNQKELEKTISKLKGTGHLSLAADLSIESDLSELVEKCPKLDGLVNNAGIPKLAPVTFIKRSDLNEIMTVNALSPIMLTSLLVKKKKILSGGSIVFISSISGVVISTLGESMYSSSKGAINGFVKGAAIDLAGKKIRVNCINPGLIETKILKLANELFSPEQIENKLSQYPLKRIGKPEDVAYGVIYLLSNASEWVTGTNIIIDGGFTLR